MRQRGRLGAIGNRIRLHRSRGRRSGAGGSESGSALCAHVATEGSQGCGSCARQSVDEALTILKYTPHIAAEPVSKVVASAAANAENNLDLSRDDLYIAEAYVDEGPTLKRIRPRARGGMANRILKRTSHITVVVREREG